MAAFDGYHKWLGIAPKDQPPNYYRLLGVDAFESDMDVIRHAADKQLAFLKTCSTWENLALAQQLMNEIAAARECLLDAKSRAAYNAGLRNSQAGGVVAVAVAAVAAPRQAPARPIAPAAQAALAADDEFDPYAEWLRIPQDQRPPTLYQLLDLSPSEEEPEKIAAAAERRKKLVQKHRGGNRDADANSILFQIEDARVTLSNPEARRKYAAALQTQHRRTLQRTAVLPRARSRLARLTAALKRRNPQALGLLATVVAGSLGVLLLIGWVVWSGAGGRASGPPTSILAVETPGRGNVLANDGVAASSASAPFEAGTSEAEAAWEIVNLEELNTSESEFSPWISADGLTLYWYVYERAGRKPVPWIWTASRPAPDAPFSERKKVLSGSFPVVSADGLELIFRPADAPGFSAARRERPGDAFGAPRSIAELNLPGPATYPRCLSADGLSLYFDKEREKSDGAETWVATRKSSTDPWDAPRPLPVHEQRMNKDTHFAQAGLTDDGKHLYCVASVAAGDGRKSIRLGALSRKSATAPFEVFDPIRIRTAPTDNTVAFVPRYVAATGELFVVSNAFFDDLALGKERQLDLWVVKNFVPPYARATKKSPR